MLNSLILAAVLITGPETPPTGIITGTVFGLQQEVSQPFQVILLPPQYTNLWISEVQKRLDGYWERLQPTFRSRKEYFIEFSKQAHRDATLHVLIRMRVDSKNDLSRYLMDTTDGGKFEFKDVPYGEYKILAIGRIGNQDVMWQEFVDVRSAIPHFLELKTRVP